MQRYCEALQHDPHDLAILGNRCATALMLKRFDVAKSDAKAVLEQDKENVRARSRLSKACLGCGDVASALDWAKQATELDPGSSALRTDLQKLQQLQQYVDFGREKLQQGDASQAAMAARRAQALGQGTTILAVDVLLAQALLKQGKGDDALCVSRNAVSKYGSNTEALLVHAEALVHTGAHCYATSHHAHTAQHS